MNKIITGIIAIILLMGVSSCVKDNFDAPPTGGKDPDIAVNFRIDSLKNRYGGTAYQINDDLVISAVVTADDKSGNFYKQIIIQDTSGGIALLLEGSNAFNDYPIGRRIFIKLKGLYVVQYKSLFQIAGSIAADGSFNGIPTALYDKYILKGSYFHPVAPGVVTMSQLNSSYQNTLIQLNNVEFQSADAGKPYADASNKASLSRVVKNCSGGSLETYNSGYSTFASQLTPTGNGTLVCIYSVYGNNAQLLLRDLSDLKMDSTRCGGGGPIGGGTGLLAIRNLYPGSEVALPSNTFARGTVISDRTGGNNDSKNLVIQDSVGGIVIRFAAAHSFNVGDVVSVDVSGLALKEFNGLLQIDKSTSPFGVPLANATKTGTGTITPRIATTADVQSNANTWESTLITIQNANISGTTYNGTNTITDITGTLNHYVRSAATFSGIAVPSGSKSFTGVLADFNGPQLSIRTLSDVQ